MTIEKKNFDSHSENVMASPPCRICGSSCTAYVRDVPLRRLKVAAPLYYCLECECFTHPQLYVESNERLSEDADWHVSVEQRNTTWSKNLFNALQNERAITSVLEIGCATGSTLAVALDRGLKVCGFDTNPFVAEKARQRHNIQVHDQLWNSGTLSEKYDLVLCISVMEHLNDPLSLMREIAIYCKRHGSIAFISVPFITEKEHLPSFLIEPVPLAPSNPLYHVDVHINHFSKKGFESMAKTAGASVITYYPYGWMHSYLLTF